MSQPDLVLLLVRVQEEANGYAGGTDTNARAANGDTATHSLSLTTNGDTHAGPLSSASNRGADGRSNSADDSYIGAHVSGYEHVHSGTLVEQLTDNTP